MEAAVAGEGEDARLAAELRVAHAARVLRMMINPNGPKNAHDLGIQPAK